MLRKASTGVLSNFIWRFAERIGAELVSFIVSIILARILAPTDYGIIALMDVFISILGVFVNAGLGSALIQKKDADDIDFSSVFYVSILLSLTIYSLLFIAAPFISLFYNIPTMIPMIRILGLTILISGVKNVQTAYVSRTMQFKRFFFATLGGTIGAAFIGIWMAYHGYGAWALIIQSLFNNTVDMIILWLTVKWRPKKLFSFERLKGLFSYGWKLLASGLLDTVYNNLRSLIIGKKYTSEDLAFYNRGNGWPSLLVSNINSSIDSVLLPTMSREQDSPATVKAMTRRAIKTSTYIVAPMLMGLACIGEPLVRLILTSKWLPSVPYMRIFCITYVFWPIHTANLNAIKAMGRSDLFLKLEIIKKTVGLTVLLITMWCGVMVMTYSLLFTSVISQIINSWPNKKLLDYPYLEQLKDILPGILLAMGMGVVVYCVQFLGLNDWLTLLIQVPLGAVIYIMGSKLFRIDSYEYVLGIAKSYLHKDK